MLLLRSVQVVALEWGKPGYLETAQELAAQLRCIDYVLAADCCYIDQDGESPSTTHFVAAARALCTSQTTTVLVCFELRSETVKETFLREAQALFGHVARVNVPEGVAMPVAYDSDTAHIELYELRV